MPDGTEKTPAWQRIAEADAAALEAAAGRGVPGAPVVDDGGLLGAAAAAAFGAGSVGTFGLSDRLLSEGSYLLGGRDFHKDVLGNVKQVREANPYATMLGEGAGLFINPSLTAAGEAVEAGVAARAGEGLLGNMAAWGTRGAFEAGALGAQRQITEDTLGDHGYNGEAIFAAGAKDALLGGMLGAGIGAGAFGLKRAAGILRGSPGPAADAVLDELAGVEGAGRKVHADARARETLIEDFRKTGMTSEQASRMVDEIDATAQAAAKAKPLPMADDGVANFASRIARGESMQTPADIQFYQNNAQAIEDALRRMAGKTTDVAEAGTAKAGGVVTNAMDDVVERIVQAQAAKHPERADLIRKAYRNKTRDLLDVENEISGHGLRMSKSGTKVARVEQELGNIQFRDKSEQFARLVDSSKLSAQADQVAGILQQVDETLSHWEQFESAGVRGRNITELRKTYKDTLKSLAGMGEGGENASRDLMLRFDKMKRAFDSSLQWGRENRFGLPEAIVSQQAGLEQLTNTMRSALEDEAVWGKAGAAQARWNKSFSEFLPRGKDFADKMRVTIDAERGVALPEVDFEKTMGMLRKLTGGEADEALQGVKSTRAYIDGMRDRISAIREYAELTPKQASMLEQGLRDIKEFEDDFLAARQKASTANRLKDAIAEERDAGSMGGLVGLVADAVTKPLTTMQRLANVRQTVQRVEDGVARGLEKFFGGKGNEVVDRIAEKLRPKAEVAKEIGEISALRGNPMAMEERARALTGDLEQHAPKIANEVRMTAVRALDYLAREAPRPSVPLGLVALDPKKARYSDQQISDWEAKRRAALDPQSVVDDMKRGKLNRDAIKAVEFVSPKLFAKMQELAQDQILKLAQQGKLDEMPYQQKAVIATLLKVPADQTWQPDFIAMMQAAKVTPVAESAPQGPEQPNTGVSKRAVEVDTAVFATEGNTIEQGGTA